MSTELEPSQYRVEKARTDAIVTLSNGESSRGYFFVSRTSPRSEGRELVSELLNAEPGFFPFEVHDSTGIYTVLFNRQHVVTVALADNEAEREPGYDVATRRVVSILLSDNQRIVGSVRVYQPEGRDRLSDWARHPNAFRYVETETLTMLVNVRHVLAVRDVARPV